MEIDGRAERDRVLLVACEQLRRLLDVAPQQTEIGEPDRRMNTAGALARRFELTECQRELFLGFLPSSGPSENFRVQSPVEAEERSETVAPRVLVDHLAPLSNALKVGGLLAGEQRVATGLGMPQSWQGHEFFCTCPTGDHGGYVIVEAASEEEVLAELPPMFKTGTRVINGVVFPFETNPASAASVGELA